MIKKEIKYENYEGEQKTMTAWFHISKSELAEFNLIFDGGLEAAVKKAQATNDGKLLLKFLKELVIMSYGKRSEEDDFFDKGDDYQYGKRFVTSPAYDSLFLELLNDENATALSEFIMGMLPRDVARQTQQQLATQEATN